MSFSPETIKVKKEEDDDEFSMIPDQHQFLIHFEHQGNTEKHEIHCDHPQTVLDAIKSCDKYELLGWSDVNIVIEQGTGDDISTVATHFPCYLVKKGETLTVQKRSYQTENLRKVDQTLLPKENYSVFFISNEGGKNSTTRKIFVTKQRKNLRSFCVYGEKGMTVKETLEQDGRFDDIKGFYLIDNKDKNRDIQSGRKINGLQGRKFKIAFPQKNVDDAKQKETPGASHRTTQKPDRAATPQKSQSENTKQTREAAGVLSVSEQRGVRVMEGCSDADRAEIYKILRLQFPDLKDLMKSRFPSNSFKEELKLMEEKFGKIQQSFKEVHRLKKLIEMGRSVCKVVVEGFCTGTGFVLFDNYIMTNAHLFDKCSDGDRLKEGTNVYVLFNYDEPEPHTNYLSFKVCHAHIMFKEDKLDYAVLQVQPDGQQTGPITQTEQSSTQMGDMKLPAGLLEKIGEMPEDGEACIIGHPGGEVKQIDLTCVIRMEERERAAQENLPPLKNTPFILHFCDQIKGDGIDKILKGGTQADKGFTINTFMYHGASGSPVFDARGQVCGLHTSGFLYRVPKQTKSVIEFAYSMKNIMKDFVSMMKEKNLINLLERVGNIAIKNPVIKEIYKSVGIPLERSTLSKSTQVESTQVEEPMEH